MGGGCSFATTVMRLKPTCYKSKVLYQPIPLVSTPRSSDLRRGIGLYILRPTNLRIQGLIQFHICWIVSHNIFKVLIFYSSAQDVVELLEKRVKSRFSHRQINLFCDYSFEDYVQVFKSFLTLPVDFSDREYHQGWVKQIEV